MAGYATGTSGTAPGAYLAGEYGPELISGRRVRNSGQTADLLNRLDRVTTQSSMANQAGQTVVIKLLSRVVDLLEESNDEDARANLRAAS